MLKIQLVNGAGSCTLQTQNLYNMKYIRCENIEDDLIDIIYKIKNQKMISCANICLNVNEINKILLLKDLNENFTCQINKILEYCAINKGNFTNIVVVLSPTKNKLIIDNIKRKTL